MKFLALGIDDADLRIIKKMDMPFIHRLIKQGSCIKLEEDILSRGWAEFYTGKHARDTKAFYDYPLLSGNYNTSQAFGIEILPEDITPIWKLISERGLKVGIMNVPTTMPAQKLNGFMVAGSGGGLNKLRSPQESLCYPKDILKLIQDKSYIVDLRLTTSGIKGISQFFSQFKTMAKKRTDVFIELCKKYKTDFSFLAYRALAIIQYLGMSELEYLFQSDHLPKGNPNNPNSIHFRKKLLEFYPFFDDLIKDIFNELQPKNFLIFSDHGKAPYLNNLNCNAFLEKIGLQIPNKIKNTNFYHTALKAIPNSIKKTIKKSQLIKIKQLSAAFDHKKTSAFSLGLINGIYINDERFGGIISGSRKTEYLVDLICKEFNSTTEAKTYSMQASPYRKKYLDSPYADYLPDIWVDKPDSMRPYSEGKYVTENRHYQHIENLTEVFDDNWTGIKGRHPLFVLNQESLNYLGKGASDLTTGYQLLNKMIR